VDTGPVVGVVELIGPWSFLHPQRNISEIKERTSAKQSDLTFI
jgi:hypothetical protein